MTIYIGDDDLLVGNTASKPLAAALFPEFAVDWIEEELDTFEKRDPPALYRAAGSCTMRSWPCAKNGRATPTTTGWATI